MSERKVIQKYYPPDFDPSAITRTKGGPKKAGPKTIPVRLMAPYSMKCTYCGEYIYKGRKFNARKETTDEVYYAIKIFRFYIKCTRCSGEITFKTDPRNGDYTCEKGAKRNFEVWRDKDAIEETDEQRLDRLEREEADEEAQKLQGDAMDELEGKLNEQNTEMAIADALDEIRTRNARIERGEWDGKDKTVSVQEQIDEARLRQEQEDEEAAKKAFSTAEGEKVRRLDDQVAQQQEEEKAPVMPPPTFQKTKKRKNNFAIPGVKKKISLV